MSQHSLASMGPGDRDQVLFLGADPPVSGQAVSFATSAWTQPNTPDGQPDLQGFWAMATFTPLERPDYLAGKEFFTEKEARMS